MAGLYSYYLAPIVLTPAQVNIPQLVNTGNRLGGWLLVQNNSPYKIQVQLPGSGNVLPLDPQTVDKLKVNAGDQQIYILPLTLLPGAAPSSQVDIQVYPGDENEPPGQYPMALTRQAAPVSSPSQFGFSASFPFNISSASAIPALNIFNPANSGVNITLYIIRLNLIFTTTNLIQASIGGRENQADLNFAVFVTISSHKLQTNPPVSVAHVTGQSTGNIGISDDFLYETNNCIVSGQVYDFLPFPSQVELHPGGNFNLSITGQDATAFRGTITFRWTEQ